MTVLEQQNASLATPGEQIRAMWGVVGQQITDVINNFEKATGVWIEEMHIGRIKGSACSHFRISFDLEN